MVFVAGKMAQSEWNRNSEFEIESMSGVCNVCVCVSVLEQKGTESSQLAGTIPTTIVKQF